MSDREPNDEKFLKKAIGDETKGGGVEGSGCRGISCIVCNGLSGGKKCKSGRVGRRRV